MKKFIKILLVLSMAFANITPFAQNTALADENITAIFVSNEGDDANDGSLKAPFKTIEKAQQEVRNLKKKNKYPENGVTVYIRGGIYSRDKSIEFTKEDSGVKDAPVIYKAYNGEDVTFVGGPSMKFSDFSKVTDESTLKRLPEQARGNVFEIDLKELGINDYANIPYIGHSMHYMRRGMPDFDFGAEVGAPELIFDHEVMTLSRWPNNDYAVISSVVKNGSVIRNWDDDMVNSKSYVPKDKRVVEPFVISVADDRLKNWQTAEDPWMYGYWYHNWSDQTTPIKTIDASKKTITSQVPSAYGVKAGNRFYVYNLLEELDSPGEWYLNRKKGMLYFWPPEEKDDALIEMSLLDTMFNINGAEYINFEEIKIKNLRNLGFYLNESNNITVDRCEISNTAKRAAEAYKVKECVFRNSKIFDTGAGGIWIKNQRSKDLVPENNRIENCEFYNYQRLEVTYMYAAQVQGCGNVISHCKFHDAPNLAIGFGGNDHMIEYNEFYNLMEETDDMGVIYAGRSYLNRGTTMRYNYFHNIKGFDGDGHIASCIYMDDGMPNTHIYGNIFAYCRQGVFLNGGRDHTVENNIFINCENAMRGTDLADAWNGGWAANGWLTMMNEMKNFPEYKQEPWKSHYPVLTTILDEEEPGKPKNNVIKNNLFLNANLKFSDRGVVDSFAKLGVMEPNFVYDRNDSVPAIDKFYSVTDATDCMQQIPEFKPIPFNQMGNYSYDIEQKLGKAVTLLVGSPNALVNNKSKLVDAEDLKVTPVIVEDRTLVPVRFIAESYGAEVGWNEETREITIDYEGKQIKMTLGSNIINVDGQDNEIDVPAQIINGRTFIPLRAMAEIAMDKKVFWDPAGLIVIGDNDKLFDYDYEKHIVENIVEQLK